jgi:hypothetical protein
MRRAAAGVWGEMRCAAAYMRGTASSVHGRRVAARLLRRRRVGDTRYCQRACQQCGRQASGKFQHELSSTVLAPLRGALLNFATPYSFAGMATHHGPMVGHDPAPLASNCCAAQFVRAQCGALSIPVH